MSSLCVVEVFDSIQGEGFWTGVPMTFVRLAGCNAPALGLECTRWCDTNGSWDPEAGEEMDIAEIMKQVHQPRLCLSGGEPLLQGEGVAPLVAAAHRACRRVHVETNGTVDPLPIFRSPKLFGAPEDAQRGFDWAVVCPKPPNYSIASGWEGIIDELKLVIDESMDVATAERLAAAHPQAVISIQPEYGDGPTAVPTKRSADRAVALVMSHPEWRLSLQTHKMLGVR